MARPPEIGSTGRRARGRPRAWADTTSQNRIKSLDRAMDVLERLSEMGSATLSDLAGELGQSPASVYRVLFTLEARDIVDFEATSQTWHIGSGAFLIGSRFLRRTSLVERVRPALRSLMERTGETASLGIERNGLLLFVSQVETHAHMRAFFPPGTTSPMHASGIGKALLAEMDEGRLAAIISRHGLVRFTVNTLTTRGALMADLAATRERGYAVDAEERDDGMRCIAAPIFDMYGEAIAGLSISGPSARMPDSAISGLGSSVIEAAQSVTSGMGGRRHE